MKERPIIMGAESVRAILEGRKTQTRRVIDPRRYNIGGWDMPVSKSDVEAGYPVYQDNNGDFHSVVERCPYGKVGDRLWVRETVFFETFHQQSDAELERDGFNPNIGVWVYRADNHDYPTITANWTSPMFMPREASRITLEITDIRVERVQDISEDDAIAEGTRKDLDGWADYSKKHVNNPDYPKFGGMCRKILETATESYRTLWDSLNTKRGYPWESNPWVWVVGFKVVQS
jgi:hypothetical protein